MIKSEYHIVAQMSGTSLDGLDIIDVSFYLNERWTFKIHNAETIPYGDSWKEVLKKLVDLTLEDLKQIDEKYTVYLAEKINEFISKHNITDIDFISSHGHTALHQPLLKLTYQIGNLPILATLTQQTVVCDFRIQDVELGGQGAPLVPIGDRLLFSEFDYCINLGGFANISTEVNGKRIAYDICPTNIVLNHYARMMGVDFDAQGKMANSGTVVDNLLKELNGLDFYSQKFPKSLGLEWVKSTVFPLINKHQLKTIDVLRTFTEHIAVQIAKEINSTINVSVLITGGGAYNKFLISRLQIMTNNVLVVPSNEIIEYKEALIFGLLGILKIRGEVNCFASVTGAKHDHSSGKIFRS